MVLAGTIIGGVAALWLAFAAWLSFTLGISMRQALCHAPLALAYRVDAGALRRQRDETRIIYVVLHQSRLDPALMLALLPGDTLHILDEYSAKAAWLEPWRELGRTIAFHPKHLFVSRRLVRILRGGGRLAVYLPADVEPDTRTFRLYRAIARIALKAEAKVVPVHIDGARNLVFSLAAREDAPRRLFPKLTILTPPPATIAELVERAGVAGSTASNALFDRAAEARYLASSRLRNLFAALRDASDRYGATRPILDDSLGASMDYRGLLTGVRVLANRFAAMDARGDAVGLLLPNAAPLVVAFFALQSAGRVAAMLNYTAGPANLAAAVRMGAIRTVVSSRSFVDKAQLGNEISAIEAAGARILWLEDVRSSVGPIEKAVGLIMHRRALAAPKADDAAVMLFTSGSEGSPKGVLLSHRNLIANAAQVEARISFSPTDRLFNVLPLFHAFGMTGGMILPVLHGVRLTLYPSPLHYKAIPEMAARTRPTIMFGTDTFLAAYARTAADDDFASLRLVVAGAEPVRMQTRHVWRERFGAEIVEGFGLTEASPVVSVNTATHSRDGSVGRLLPAIRARLDPVEGIADGGRLHISGPNVMLGYRTTEDPGKTIAPPGGWHDTGDIVSFDKDGFITIRGRAKRFAKIAGEMVSLSAVELVAQELWPEGQHAAVAIPDERKGERIVLVTTSAEADRNRLRTFARKSGVAEIAVPAEIVPIEEIPVLGSGKTDYAGLLKLALDALGVGKAA